MTPYSFPGASLLDQRKYYYHVVRNRKIAYAKKFELIIDAVEKCTGFDLKAIQSKQRKPPLPFLRAIISEELYEPDFVAYAQIGRDLKKDHTTIMYYIKELIPSVDKNDEFILLKQNIKKYF